MKAINWIKARLTRFLVGDVSSSLWEYGTCNGIYARCEINKTHFENQENRFKRYKSQLKLAL